MIGVGGARVLRRSGGPSFGAVLVDCAAVLGGVALALTLLDESFWSRQYLVAGLTPVVFLLGLALLLRNVTDGVWWYWLTVLAAYAPLGALVALRRPGPWIVPTFDTMTRVLGETAAAPGLFVSTLPPVEASGTVMLLPYAIGFLSAAPAAWLALGTTRPVAPVLPLLVGLGAAIPMAVLVPDHYVLRGVVFAALVASWAAGRSRRAEAAATLSRGRGGVTAALVAVLVIAAVSGAVGYLVPDDDQTERVVLRPRGDGADLVAAAADSVVPPQAGGGELFRASGLPLGRRIRIGALDLYDGEAWVPAGESPGAGALGTFRRVDGVITPVHEGREVRVRVRIGAGYTGDWLPTVGELTSIELDYTDGRSQLRDLRYNQATSSVLVVGGVDPRDDYTFTSVLTPESFRSSDDAAVATEGQRQPEGEFLDQYLLPFDRTELSPLRRVLLLARYLRQNGEVRLSGPSSQRPVDLGLRFLGTDRIVGSPFQYTAVMALGASRLGVPARIVVGAEPGRGGVVRSTDVTTWVELQLVDGTWRSLDPERYTAVHLYDKSQGDDVVAAGKWVREELDLDESEIKIPKGADIELDADAVLEEQTSPWETFGLVVAALAAAVLVAWACVPAAKIVRRARRRRRVGDERGWSSAYVGGWQEVLDAALDRGTPVGDTWSRVAQARHLEVPLDLARSADAAVFAPAPSPLAARRAFWDETQHVRRQLLEYVSWKRRAWASMNPASFAAGWERNRRSRAVVASAGAGPVGHEDRRARREQPAGA